MLRSMVIEAGLLDEVLQTHKVIGYQFAMAAQGNFLKTMVLVVYEEDKKCETI